MILDGDGHHEIGIAHVYTMQILTEGFTPGAGKHATGMILQYPIPVAEAATQLRLIAGEDANGSKRQAAAWLAATHKATKLLHEIMKPEGN